MKKFLRFFREQGGARLGACILCKIFYRGLRLFFPFDRWHATAPYPCRDYKRRVVALAASRRPSVVADLGCGLGEVVSRIPADMRYGFDPDGAAIRAARLLFGRKARFARAALADANVVRDTVIESGIDLLVMTNWTHGVKADELRRQLLALQAVIPVGAILVDTVRPGAMAGAQCHTLADFAGLGTVVASCDGGDGVRDLHVLVTTHSGP
jgi:hypothetical protein